MGLGPRPGALTWSLSIVLKLQFAETSLASGFVGVSLDPGSAIEGMNTGAAGGCAHLG
jgi:hypothetical protein